MVLPVELQIVLDQKARMGWAGTITLNLKDGRVQAFEVTEKHRITQETHASPAPRRGQGHGEQLQH